MIILTLQTHWSLGDKPACDIVWGDSSSETVEFDQDPQLDVEHVYVDYGVYVPTISCSDYAGNFQACPRQNSRCSETAEMFDAFYRSFATPLKNFVHERLAVSLVFISANHYKNTPIQIY